MIILSSLQLSSWTSTRDPADWMDSSDSWSVCRSYAGPLAKVARGPLKLQAMFAHSKHFLGYCFYRVGEENGACHAILQSLKSGNVFL